ncbi:MAG: hypothetical protein IJF18_04760 [Oscillospiraceae bacterium]|nr:hypothetical protein [Oscillospiraceae bacterium]
MTAKISCKQFLILLLICRIFTLMTFVPLASEGYAFTSQITAMLISTAIQAVLVIPVILFSRLCPDTTVTAAIKDKNKAAGIIAAALYLIFFLAHSVNCTIHFMEFLRSRFFYGAGAAVMLAVFAAACVYCAYCGIEGLARSGAFVLIFFVLTIILMTAASFGNFSTLNFYSDSPDNSLWKAVTDDLARNCEITAAAFLIKNTDKPCRKGLYGLLAAKLVLTALIMSLVTGILGGYAQLTDYPFMEVGSYSETRLFQRNDSLYLILWTLAAVISVSLFIRITAGLACEIAPKLKFASPVAGAAVFLISALSIYADYDFARLAGYICGGFAVTVFTGLIPLAAYLILRKKGGGAVD